MRFFFWESLLMGFGIAWGIFVSWAIFEAVIK
jgi:hypothetical protein